MNRQIAVLAALVYAIPRFMGLEVERIETKADLLFQVNHEIDLAEEGDLKWSPSQMERAKAFRERVKGAS